jgi:hypothetical protein
MVKWRWVIKQSITKPHMILYDLKTLLEENGFKDPVYWEWQKVDHGKFDDHSQAYLNPKGDKINGECISLNVECKKK